MNTELLEEIRNKYREKYKVNKVEEIRIFQLELIGKLRYHYYKLRQSKSSSERLYASKFFDCKINNFFYTIRNNKRRLTQTEIDYLLDFFCNAPPVC